MRLLVRFPALVVAVVLSLCLKASPAAQPAPLTGVDDLVARAMKDWRVPGLAMAVAKDGQIVIERGYGVRQAGQPDAVDTHTLFAIGSTTKAMTAALVGMLVDDKLLAWDDPVVKHLPWFQLKDPAVTRELTVRDLLTHRGGLGNADYLWYGQSNSTEEILKRVRLIEPAYSVRSNFIYQNIMYAAAGAVIEAAATSHGRRRSGCGSSSRSACATRSRPRPRSRRTPTSPLPTTSLAARCASSRT